MERPFTPSQDNWATASCPITVEKVTISMPLSDETELNTMSNDIIVYGGS